MLPPQKHYTGHCWWVICDTKMVIHLQVPAYRMMVAHDLVRNDRSARSFKVNIKNGNIICLHPLYLAYRRHL